MGQEGGMLQEVSVPTVFLSHAEDKTRPTEEGNENFRRQLLRAQYDGILQESTLIKAALYSAIKKLEKCYPQISFKNS